jgi:hypothetical protein
LNNEVLHILYSPPNINRQIKSRRMKWAVHVARMGEENKMNKGLVGKLEVKKPRGRPRRKWENGIRMDVRETGWGSVSWIKLGIGTSGGLL